MAALCHTANEVAVSNVAALLEHGERYHPALVVPNRVSISYAQLRQLTEETAHKLVSYGIGKGERGAMVSTNGLEAIVLFLATSTVATACPLNPAYKEDEFRFYLEDVGAQFLVVPPGEAEARRKAITAGRAGLEELIGSSSQLRLE